MIKFGVPTHGVHINGYVRLPAPSPPSSSPSSSTSAPPSPASSLHIWVGIRSPSKATYPGLRDVLAAGGQPSGLTFLENAVKEAEEEASIPRGLLQGLRPGGMISYRYQTKHGLSTKLLNVFDLELPPSFIPYNGDGEVESFHLMPLSEALHSLEHELSLWKPNAALTVLDFAVRHGAVDADHEHYIEICHLLRGAFIDKKMAEPSRESKGGFYFGTEDAG
ncbi:nudix family protein [Nannochloropsis gaditana]|uniref:Nudix family protein n=1 Tax=Nannochloropsis gaditana TaxID=72520 RepID=W7TTV5_9STRA|nr:nudix family protein [Nannochloropsis gaditana]